ncbi:hypothetical protein C7K08_07210 [Synechococcus lacustris str. Tous]|uniref:Uncharacterized protein n=1 Tax=Synechococcus lacustris str. Tous TaxID=1910958 RepID=A0A2P7EEG0_9SYNE|nr:hypothetical protein C7K08_07210 [Synechococcus lacustris str. Tous]
MPWLPLPSKGEATVEQAIPRIGRSASRENKRLNGGQGTRSPFCHSIAPSTPAMRVNRLGGAFAS